MHKERTGRFIAGRALAETALSELEAEGIRKAVFAANDTGNAFWEHLGFSVRTDLTYCDRKLSCAFRCRFCTGKRVMSGGMSCSSQRLIVTAS